jgi:hypothetical protein
VANRDPFSIVGSNGSHGFGSARVYVVQRQTVPPFIGKLLCVMRAHPEKGRTQVMQHLSALFVVFVMFVVFKV